MCLRPPPQRTAAAQHSSQLFVWRNLTERSHMHAGSYPESSSSCARSLMKYGLFMHGSRSLTASSVLMVSAAEDRSDDRSSATACFGANPFTCKHKDAP